MTQELSISKGELVHHQIQAIMRDHEFAKDQLMYLGHMDCQHWYLIGGEHEVSSNELEGMELAEEPND